jgi:hypothetical protein
VFLVGAAWLPLAVCQLDRLLVGRRPASAVPLGLTLALMVLGGDPQMAYHVVLLGVLYALLLRREKGSGVSFVTNEHGCAVERCRHETGSRPLYRFSTNRLVLLIAASVIAAGLAAVQILPSWELNARSERAARDEPRNIYQTAADLMAGDHATNKAGHWQGLLARPTGDAHATATYEFSVGPWRLMEYVWPNVAGREFPTNRRWLSALPAEGRVWVPSFYMGLLPLTLALAAWRLRRADLRTQWLSWLVLLSVLGSLGLFGLGRLIREVAVHWNDALVDPAAAAVGDPFGGVYWLMTVLLPGYDQFRYPAKLLVVASLGLSVLAARGWDEVATGSPSGRRARRLLLFIALASVACLAMAVALGGWWTARLTEVADKAGNPLFGPLEIGGAWQDMSWAFAQAAIVGLAGWWIVRRALKAPIAVDDGAERRNTTHRWRLAYAVIALTAIDMGVANRWMIAAAPAEEWRTPSAAAEAIRATVGSYDQPFRVDRPHDFDLWPEEWSSERSPTRQRDGLARDRDTLLPKYALAESIEILHAQDTSAVLEYQLLLDGIRRWSKGRGGVAEGDDGHPGGLVALGVRYLILPRGLRPPGGQWRPLENKYEGGAAAHHLAPAHSPVGRGSSDVRIWENTAALPRAWIVHHVDVLPLPRSDRIGDVVERTSEVLFPDGQPRDLGTSAAVEASDAEGVLSNLAARGSTLTRSVSEEGSPLTSGDSAPRPRVGLVPPSARPVDAIEDHCRIVSRGPDCVRVDATVAEPGGLLVLSDLYYPGWQAVMETDGGSGSRPVPILRTNRVMRGVPLPPGKHRVTFSYRPASVMWGAAVSGTAWIGLLGWGVGVIALLQGRRRRQAQRPQRAT